MDLAFDVETYEKKGEFYEPILDGTGKHFLIGSITNENNVSKIFEDKREMWEYILREGKKARKHGHCIYAYAHNIKYDFYNLFKPEPNLVVLSEYPFVAIYYVNTKKEVDMKKWESYRKWLDMSKRRYRFSLKNNYVEVDLKEEAVRFVDTMSLFRMSLKRVGEMIGLEKLDLPKKLKKEDLQDSEMIDYVKRDTEILIKAVKMLKQKIKGDGINIKRLVTMNQVAISYLLKMIKEKETPIFRGKGERVIQGKARRKVRKAYRGGRVEAWGLGTIRGVSSIDVNSLYPYAASIIDFPDLKSEVFWNKPKKETWEELLDKVGVCRAMLYNNNNNLGMIPVRLPHISYFPKRKKYLIGTWTNREVREALSNGYKIINIQFIITYDKLENPFKEIMSKLFELRNDKELGEFNRSFYKSVMNGGIGKFAQTKIGQEIVFDNIEKTREYLEANYESLGGIRDDSRTMKFKKSFKEFKYKPYYCPLIPALVTAEARLFMYKIYKMIGEERIIYTDTDNCTFKGNIKDLPKGIKIGEGLGEFKVEFENVEFECWGRKSKRINDEIRASGVSKNDLRVYDKRTGKIRYAKMQGLKKDKVGLFVEEEKDLKKQAENYLKQEKELEEPLIYIDDTILKDIREEHGDGKNKDDIFFFKEDIRRVTENFKSLSVGRKELKGGRKI